MAPKQDPDATINARRPLGGGPEVAGKISARDRRISTVVMVGGLAGLFILGGAGYFLLGPPTTVPVKDSTRLPAPVSQPATQPAALRITLPHRSESEILTYQAAVPTAVWFSANPLIMVVDYPDLKLQGSAFNRMAAFIEKAGLPRDRVLSDSELSAAIISEGATPETYYYGHDYRIADISRFFATAIRQKIELAPEEERLRDLLIGVGKLSETAVGAIISLPREGSDAFVDASGRASLLRHELSHGEYFTIPAYAKYCLHFWANEMSEGDRAAFRNFLTRQGYDPTDEDLLVNEMQAHLMHTTDTRYFNARESGLPRARIEALRLQFLTKMPPSWLKEATSITVSKLP